MDAMEECVTTREATLNLVYAAIDEVNAAAAEEAILQKSPDARLLGGDGSIDSLTFVNLIIAIEEQIQKTMGASIVLVSENSMTQQLQPFRTVGTLAAYVATLLSAPAN